MNYSLNEGQRLCFMLRWMLDVDFKAFFFKYIVHYIYSISIFMYILKLKQSFPQLKGTLPKRIIDTTSLEFDDLVTCFTKIAM